jgi:protein-tyrosine phosphatase
MKILMVCLGNICRSPLAEGILKDKIKKNKLNIQVDSCGFEYEHLGCQPDYRAIQIAIQHNIDITAKKARLFSVKDFDQYDKILVMDQNNYRMVSNIARSKEDLEKIDLIMNLLHPGKNMEVPDPYYGKLDNFNQTYQMLDLAMDKIIELIKNKIWK